MLNKEKSFKIVQIENVCSTLNSPRVDTSVVLTALSRQTYSFKTDIQIRRYASPEHAFKQSTHSLRHLLSLRQKRF